MLNEKVILLVEDNANDELLTLKAFKKNDIPNQVVVARDGVEALDYIFGTGVHMGRDIRQMPAVIILDLKLPKVDGLEVLRRIRSDERTKFQPVVVLTSSKEDRDILEAYTLGTNAYVQKPVDFMHFLNTVQQLGLFWLCENELPPMAYR